MMQRLKPVSFENLKAEHIQTGCMVVIGLITSASMIIGSTMIETFSTYVAMCMNVAAAIFLGTVLGKKMHAVGKHLLGFGLLFCLWLCVQEIFHLRFFTFQYPFEPRFGLCAMFCEYMMLLPWAGLREEKGKDTGLIIMILCVLLAIVGYLLLIWEINRGKIPHRMEDIMYFIPERVGLMWHPNVLADILLMGMGATLALAFWVPTYLLKIPLAIMSFLEFYAIVRSDSRTVLVMACLLYVGIVCFWIYSRFAKKNPKKFLFIVGIIGAVLICGTVYWIIQETDFLTSRRIDGFNGRTGIWKSTFHAIAEDPIVLLYGVDEFEPFFTPHYFTSMPNAHNAWIESLVRLGVPGLLLACYVTWLSLKNAFLVLFDLRHNMFRKVIALTALGIMGSQFFESYLFITECPHNIVQIAFMLMTGYLVYWVRLENDRKEQGNQEEKEVQAQTTLQTNT